MKLNGQSVAVVIILSAELFAVYQGLRYVYQTAVKVQLNRMLQVENWKRYQPRAITLFNELDGDHDGLIYEQELLDGENEGNFASPDIDVIRFLRENIRRVGHVVAVHPGKNGVAVWAISHPDLKATHRPGRF